MNFDQLILKVLEEAKEALSSEQIWAFAISKGYDKELGSQGKTPPATIGALIYKQIKDDSNYPVIKIGYRPTVFCLKKYEHTIDKSFLKENPKGKKVTQKSSIENQIESSIIEVSEKKISFLEKDLHPYLNNYARLYMKCYCKTIRHNVSSGKEFGDWVHPDMVGCYFSLGDLEPDVFDLTKSLGSVGVKICSFELKRELNFNNLRASFFQCVSNSTWANESYLVAAKFSEDDDFFDELQRLSNSFGIGIIKLDILNPNASETLYSAKFKSDLDWDMVNKLSRMNKDFKTFLERINKDLASKEIITERYDTFVSDENLIKGLKFI